MRTFSVQIQLTNEEVRHLIQLVTSLCLSNFPGTAEDVEPAPKATAPDRPSNVGPLNPTVELPDLGEMDF